MDEVVVDAVKEVVENITENANTKRTPSTPEGMAVAYGSLVIMAMLPIFLGSIRSVKHHKEQKVLHKVTHTHNHTHHTSN